MKTLLRGVNVYQQQPLTHRVTLSSGTCHLDSTDNQVFAPDSRVPTLPWHAPEPQQAELLLAATLEAFRFSQSLAVINLPEAIVAALAIFHNDAAVFDRPSGQIALQAHQLALVEEIQAYIMQNCCFKQDQLTMGPVVASLPNLITKTFDRNQGRFIGLHLDSWDNDPLQQRASSTNRICVNLGKEERTFLFLNLTVQQIADLLYPAAEQASWEHHPPQIHRLGHDFMAQFPAYPIVSVVVRPGEAYIAPTENIFHDGATQPSDHLNFTLTLRGYFAPPGHA